jgi:hypothetical protein
MTDLEKAIDKSRERVDAAEFRQKIMVLMHHVAFEDIEALQSIMQLPVQLQAKLHHMCKDAKQ